MSHNDIAQCHLKKLIIRNRNTTTISQSSWSQCAQRNWNIEPKRFCSAIYFHTHMHNVVLSPFLFCFWYDFINIFIVYDCLRNTDYAENRMNLSATIYSFKSSSNAVTNEKMKKWLSKLNKKYEWVSVMWIDDKNENTLSTWI